MFSSTGFSPSFFEESHSLEPCSKLWKNNCQRPHKARSASLTPALIWPHPQFRWNHLLNKIENFVYCYKPRSWFPSLHQIRVLSNFCFWTWFWSQCGLGPHLRMDLGLVSVWIWTCSQYGPGPCLSVDLVSVRTSQWDWVVSVCTWSHCGPGPFLSVDLDLGSVWTWTWPQCSCRRYCRREIKRLVEILQETFIILIIPGVISDWEQTGSRLGCKWVQQFSVLFLKDVSLLKKMGSGRVEITLKYFCF